MREMVGDDKDWDEAQREFVAEHRPNSLLGRLIEPERDREPGRLPELGARVGHHRRRDPRRRRLRRPHPAVIAVTGATGEVGRRVAARLDGPLLVVRDAVRARRPGAEVAASATARCDEMRAALTGADTVFLIPAAESADRVEQHRTAVDAAVAAGVRAHRLPVVPRRRRPTPRSRSARDHWATEQHIRATGLPWTFLRMNLYMDFIPSMVGRRRDPRPGRRRARRGDPARRRRGRRRRRAHDRRPRRRGPTT